MLCNFIQNEIIRKDFDSFNARYGQLSGLVEPFAGVLGAALG